MAIRITYNSVNIDLLLDKEALQIELVQEQSQNKSASGKIETINQYGIQEMSFAAILTEAVERELQAWWAWARQGRPWAFSMDSGNTGNTTLDAAANSGQKNVPLTATAAFLAADICLLRAQDADDEFEIVIIASVDAGVKIVAESNLVYSYASGDLFRHREYWPEVISLDKKFKPEKEGDIYRHTFNFVEKL